MSDFGTYKGDELLNLDIKPREWLVEGLIRAKDSVILVGNEKSGKSLFLFQLVYSLTSQRPFLDHYKITKPCKVTYFQLEGELNDSVDRIRRIHKTHELIGHNFILKFYPPLELQSETYRISFEKTIIDDWQGETPDILIIDPIYFSFFGGMNNDEQVRRFIGNIRCLKEKLGCAVLLVHHTHKTRFAVDGTVIEEGDEAIFGSKFLKAWADHILMFTYDKKKDLRILSCNTQRSGDIVKECVLRLIEPDPLYFEIYEEKKPTEKVSEMDILYILREYKQGLSCDEIVSRLNITQAVCYRTLKKLLSRGEVTKSYSTRPIIYQAKEITRDDKETLSLLPEKI